MQETEDAMWLTVLSSWHRFCGVTDQGNFEDHGVDGEVLQYLVDAGNRIHTQDFAMLADDIGKRNKRKKVDYCK
jgi:hypothetical protein